MSSDNFKLNMQAKQESCVVVFSGGQDSTTCLFWARQRFERIEALTFDYGQRHRIELDASREICSRFGFSQTILPVNTFQALGGNSLVDKEIEVRGSGLGNLPDSFVPGRNLVFMTYAAAFAWQRGIKDLVTGVCQTDYSGYPDCRQNTMEALEKVVSLGMESTFKIHTPLMFLTKAQSIHLAQEVGALDALAYSHTCYNGQCPPCGTCPACLLRAKGFADAGLPDPLVQRTTKDHA
jgi:7-cyano-7-deazaguanine synthase